MRWIVLLPTFLLLTSLGKKPTGPAGPLYKGITLPVYTQKKLSPPSWTWAKSPNHTERTETVDTVVVHCTVSSTAFSAINSFRTRDVSAHVIIPDPGGTDYPIWISYRAVADERRALHVRNAVEFYGKTNVNNRSLGLEIVNLAIYEDPYSEWQVKEAARWIVFWRSKLPITKVVTHALLDPSRRRDPCVTFPWEKMINYVQHPYLLGVFPPLKMQLLTPIPP